MKLIREVNGVYEVERDYKGEAPKCKYAATNVMLFYDTLLLSNNLKKLKERIKEKGWVRAWIVVRYEEPNRYGDVIADEFYYTPKYK